MNAELSKATDSDIPVLRRLMQFYLYEIAALDGWDLREDGTYGNPERIESFWEAARYERFLIRVDGALAGFALTSHAIADGEPVSEMNEFFVLRRYRGNGIGRNMATAVFGRITGAWKLSVLPSNRPAEAFWRAVIPTCSSGGRCDICPATDGSGLIEFRFETEIPEVAT